MFDWDGTLMDSTGLIAHCIRTAAIELGLPEPDESAAKFVIGLGLQDATAHLFPRLSDAERLEFALRFRHHYVVRDHEAPLYDGVTDMLKALKRDDRFMAIATGKPRAGLDRALVHTGLKAYFDFTRCADEGFPKPHPDMLERLMDFCAVDRERVLMIGDTTHDLLLAANAGVRAIAVNYGAHPMDALQAHAPMLVAQSVQELHEWLITNA
ncbi:MAG: HAD-IA family hydrolase [Burkholderiales bacterium]|nr:HAD-IA family hydrolase [Burkholderiales bacterium]